MTGEEAMPLPVDEREDANQLALDWQNAGQAISETQIVSKKVGDIPGWEGLSKDAYADEAEALKVHAKDLSDRFPEIKKALESWATALEEPITTTIPDLQAKYDDANTKYRQDREAFQGQMKAAEAEGNPYSTYERNEGYRIIEEARETAQGDLLKQYDGVMTTLNTAAQDAANIIQTQVDTVVDPDVAAQGRNAIGASLFDDMPLVDGQAEWEYAEEEATGAAAILNKDVVTPEDIRKFQEKYGDLCDNPFFANALSEKVTPEAMTHFLMFASQWQDNVMTPDGKAVDKDFNSTLEDMVGSLGTALVLSTGGMNADPTMASAQASFDLVRGGLLTDHGQTIDALMNDRLNEIKVVGNNYYHADGSVVGSDEQHLGGFFGDHYGYEYLGHMLGCAALDNPNLALGPEFLDGDNSVARDMVKWDHDHLGELVASGEYGNWNKMPGGSSYDVLRTADPITSMMMLLDEPAALSDGTLSPDSDAYKFLSGQSTERIDSVRDFLLSDSPLSDKEMEQIKANTGDGEDVSIARYLTGHRQIPPYFYGSTDQGEAFGEVLAQASATTPMPDIDHQSPEFKIWNDRDEKSTRIAGDFIVGYQEGLNWDDSTWQSEDTFGQSNSNLRSWAGTILAPHLEGIATSIQNPDTGTALSRVAGIDGTDPHEIRLNPKMRDWIIGKNGLFVDLAYDEAVPDGDNNAANDVTMSGRPPALQTLIRAAGEGYALDLSQGLQGHDPDSLILAKQAQQRWAGLLNDLNVAPGMEDMAKGKAIDDANAAFKNLVSQGAGMIPIGKILDAANAGEGVKWLVDQGKGIGLPWALDNWFATNHEAAAADEVLDAHNGVEEYMRQTTYSVLAANDYWGTDSAHQPEAWINQEPDSRSNFMENGHVKPYDQMTKSEQESFRDYIEMTTGQATTYQDSLINTLDPALNDAQTERSEVVYAQNHG